MAEQLPWGQKLLKLAQEQVKYLTISKSIREMQLVVKMLPTKIYNICNLLWNALQK